MHPQYIAPTDQQQEEQMREEPRKITFTEDTQVDEE
jgi:hypothetical protein